jgi:hypothetical protein
MSRYFGLARGRRRRKKPFPLLPLLAVLTAGTFLAAVIVFTVNPGSDIPDEEKGSVTPTLVLPESTTTSPDPTDSEQPGTA